jgi:hypothetical protein
VIVFNVKRLTGTILVSVALAAAVAPAAGAATVPTAAKKTASIRPADEVAPCWDRYYRIHHPVLCDGYYYDGDGWYYWGGQRWYRGADDSGHHFDRGDYATNRGGRRH